MLFRTEKNALWQYDQGMRLIVPTEYADCLVQFYTQSYPDGLAVEPYKEDENLCCEIPNQILMQSEKITVYAYTLTTNKAVTESRTEFIVRERPMPPDFVLEPTETITYSTAKELIRELNDTKEKYANVSADAKIGDDVSASAEVTDDGLRFHFVLGGPLLDGKADVTNGTVISGNADFAEVGEWADGNVDDDDRIGYFVSIDTSSDGITMVKSNSTSDVRGVTVAAPAFSGNCSEDKFDSNKILLKQYDFVAVMGLVTVIDNGSCTINGRCMPSDDGTAIPDEQAMARERMDADGGTMELLVDAVLEEDAKTFVVQIPKSCEEIIYHTWTFNDSGATLAVRHYVGDDSLDCLARYATFGTGSGISTNGFAKHMGNIESYSIVGYSTYSNSSNWTSDNNGNGANLYMTYPHYGVITKISRFKMTLDTGVLKAGTVIRIWGR